MINTLQELLSDYARYSFMEDKIGIETSETLQKGAKDYIKRLRELKLLNIPVVSVTLVCPTCETELDKMDNGKIFCPICLNHYKQIN